MTEKLKLLEELDIIEIDNGPTSWINPLVAVEKPNGDIRICLDMRQANRATLREKHPVPTVEETLQEISKAKAFIKLDLNMAFHQIEPHPDSRHVTTFAAPDMATEKFQQLIWQILKDCPGAYNLHDDVRVVGRDHKEHDEEPRVLCIWAKCSHERDCRSPRREWKPLLTLQDHKINPK